MASRDHDQAVSVALERQPYWVSWYGHSGTFELHSPWWISGYGTHDGEGCDVICAALMATSDEDARAHIAACHDDKADQWFRFIEPRRAAWSPFSDRFLRADWMQWPHSSAPLNVGDKSRDEPKGLRHE